MSIEAFIEEFEEAVEDVEEGTLSESTIYRNLEQWDSLAVLTVIAMVDSEYEVRLKADDLKSCDTLNALYELVQGKSKG
ncbi:MAG: phosphopantetheine-binding protein [Opitutaceae bacterium]